MKIKFLLTALVAVFTFSAFAQPQVSWQFSFKKTDDTHGVIVGKAKLIPGWHIFSTKHDPAAADMTGTPTSWVIKPSKDFKLDGPLKDAKAAKPHVDDMGTSLFFEGEAVFVQKFVSLTDKPFTIVVTPKGQVCDEGGCVFLIDNEYPVEVKGMKLSTAEVVEETQEPVSPVATVNEEKHSGKKEPQIKQGPDRKKSSEDKESRSWLGIFLAGFGGGLVALLTPCMFPMIPMTVTFFTKQSKTRREGIMKALLYGVSIIVIYVIIGLVVTALLGPTGLQELSTNAVMNIIFFAVFILFAFSFLGAFEIQLPTSWVNKADAQADRKGLVGIFFMAFTLGLVSFSCTGPIIGTLLVEAASSGSLAAPAIGMTGFSMALAIPFTLFAIFPGWLNSLPQSGGWLNSVKVVLGLLELALAMKFLSGVDLAYHWEVITREVFVAIWIACFGCIAFYLFGKLRFSHDSPVEKLSVTRFMFGLSSLVFTIYLIPGMWGAPLLLIDGVAPPRTNSEDGFRFNKGEGGGSAATFDPALAAYQSEMHDVGDGSIRVFHDLEKGREYAKKVNKPVLLDFTGHNCPNCRRTESKVWLNDEIRPILQNDVVIISLYTDDRTDLPESEWKYSDALQGNIRTVGNKWADFQVRNYKQNSQPLYVITDADGNDLSAPIPYTPAISEYKSFLEKGIAEHKKKS